MNHTRKLFSILFLDIETVPGFSSFEELSQAKKILFEKKTHYQRKELITPEEFYDNAGIWAEFGKIICISVGFFSENQGELKFSRTSFYGHDELYVLGQFKKLLHEKFNLKTHLLCAHNGKEFDFPYLARRMIIQGIPLPEILNLFGKKPWEVRHLDTMEMWKFGDYKHFTSLELLTNVLGIPSPKCDISGKQVAKVYYQDQDLERIVKYCERDVLAVAQVYSRFMNMPLLSKEQVETNSGLSLYFHG